MELRIVSGVRQMESLETLRVYWNNRDTLGGYRGEVGVVSPVEN